MDTSSNPSSKSEVTSKKNSNRRVKTKLSPILHENTDSSNHTGDNTKTENLNELDSPTANITSSKTLDSNNISMIDTANMNNSASTSVEHNGNDPRLIIKNHSHGDDCSNDNSQICAATMNDRKLFMDCANGDLDKYKHSVMINSNRAESVWIGVTAKFSSIKFFICVKNADNSLNTFFMDSNSRQQFESSLVSFIENGGLNWSEGLGQSSLEYSRVNDHLVIKDMLYPRKMVIFDDTMIYSYWSKKWELMRFVEYLQKTRDMLHYSQHIFATFANCEKTNVTKNDFIDKFENSKPPNYIFTSTEMWNYFNKNFLRN